MTNPQNGISKLLRVPNANECHDRTAKPMFWQSRFAVIVRQYSADRGNVLESPLQHRAILSMSILIAGLLPVSVYGHLKNNLTKKECSLPIENPDDIYLNGTQRIFVPLQEFVRRHTMTVVFFQMLVAWDIRR